MGVVVLHTLHSGHDVRVLNLAIAVIVNSMQTLQKAERAERAGSPQRARRAAPEVVALRGEVAELKGILSKAVINDAASRTSAASETMEPGARWESPSSRCAMKPRFVLFLALGFPYLVTFLTFG